MVNANGYTLQRGEKRLVIAYIAIGLAHLAVGLLLGFMQGMEHAGIDLYKYTFLRHYYQGLSMGLRVAFAPATDGGIDDVHNKYDHAGHGRPLPGTQFSSADDGNLLPEIGNLAQRVDHVEVEVGFHRKVRDQNCESPGEEYEQEPAEPCPQVEVDGTA